MEINAAAFSVVQQADGESTFPRRPYKNPAAFALGRLGGLKAGKAGAEKLSTKQKIRIARKAARARWRMASED